MMEQLSYSPCHPGARRHIAPGLDTEGATP
jgi:hypothetical protein